MCTLQITVYFKKVIVMKFCVFMFESLIVIVSLIIAFNVTYIIVHLSHDNLLIHVSAVTGKYFFV